MEFLPLEDVPKAVPLQFPQPVGARACRSSYNLCWCILEKYAILLGRRFYKV